MRCVRSGVVCSGPVQTRTTFIHRDQTNLQNQSHRRALLAAMNDRRRLADPKDPPPYAAAITEQRAHWFDPFGYVPLELRPLTSSIFASLGPGKSLYEALLHEFEPRGKAGIFGADRTAQPHALYSGFAICTRSLLSFASSGGTVIDSATFSVLTAYVGHMRRELELVDLATRSYTQAIGQSRSQIALVTSATDAGSRQSRYQTLIFLTMAFQLFEASDFAVMFSSLTMGADITYGGQSISHQRSSETGLVTHSAGLAQLLQLMGPKSFQTPFWRQTFSGLRGVLVSACEFLLF